MIKWEYKWLHISRHIADTGKFKLSNWEIEFSNKKIEGQEAIIEYLNTLGDEGWELISALGEHWAESTWMRDIHLMFKRPKQ